MRHLTEVVLPLLAFLYIIINTRRTCARELLQSVCLSVYVCVCYQCSFSVRRLCDKMNLQDRSSLNTEGF